MIQIVLMILMDQVDQSNRVAQTALNRPSRPLFQEILEDQMVQEILQVLVDQEAQVDLEAQMDLENQPHHAVQPDQDHQFLQLIQDHQLHLVVQLVQLHRWVLRVLEDQDLLLVQTVLVDLPVQYHLDFQLFQVIQMFLLALLLLGDRLVQLDQSHQVYPADHELLGHLSVLSHLLDLSDPLDLPVPLVHLLQVVLWDQTVQVNRQNLLDPVVQHLLCFLRVLAVQPDQ